MVQRKETTVKVSRTVQLYQYEPMTVELVSLLQSTNGSDVGKDDIEMEIKRLECLVDKVVTDKINSLKS